MTNINQYDEEGERHGYWEGYRTNGNLMYKGNYDNGNIIGYWEWYDKNGELETQILYT